MALVFNNNNEYLERLTRTGPKRLHVLYKYILSKFNAYIASVFAIMHFIKFFFFFFIFFSFFFYLPVSAHFFFFSLFILVSIN